MSYILDALKKAERERDLKRVPTVTTAHVSVSRAERRVGLWVVAGVLLIGGGLAIWFLRPSTGLISPAPTTLRSGPGILHSPSRADLEQRPEPERAAGTTPGLSAPPTLPGVPVWSQPAPLPRAMEAPPRGSSESNRLAEGDGAKGFEVPRPVGNRVAEALPTGSPRDGSKADPGKSAAPGSSEASPALLPEPAPLADRGRAEVGTPSAPSAPLSSQPLRDAMAKMTLNVFVYADAEADRMVIINGRRYLKGQNVDERYLVEDITPEGVLLSFQGERILLRP